MTPPPPTPGPPGWPRPSQSGRLNAPTDLRSRAHARLAERIDLSRSRHKPLSLLRAEAKRVLDSFYDAECLTLTRSERDRLAEDTIAASVGFSPLEELFRDAAVEEILVLGAGQALARKGQAWVPANARYRDGVQFRAALAWLAELGEPVAPGASSGGLDVRLPNGFRLIAVVPPDVLEQPPLALFVRGTAAPSPPASGVFSGPSSGRIPITPTPTPTPAPKPVTSASDSGVLGRTPTAGPISGVQRVGGAPSGAHPDPFAKIRQRVTERIISQLAAAGVYDLNQFPPQELRKIVGAFVAEQVAIDRLGLDAATQERLVIEILAGMNR